MAALKFTVELHLLLAVNKVTLTTTKLGLQERKVIITRILEKHGNYDE